MGNKGNGEVIYMTGDHNKTTLHKLLSNYQEGEKLPMTEGVGK